MAKVLVSFDPHNILNLLTHYSDGKLPLDAELLALGQHAILQREIGMVVRSAQWDDPRLKNDPDALAPLYINYDGKKVMTWGTRDGQDIHWQEGPSS